MARFLVYREDLVGSLEAPDLSYAYGEAFRQHGQRVTRVVRELQPGRSGLALVADDARVDRQRADCAREKETRGIEAPVE